MSLAPMSLPVRPRVPRRRTALAGAALTLLLAGCGQTGFEAQTNARYDPGVGSNEAFGDVPVLAVLVVDNGDQTGTLSATLTRRTDEEVSLTGITATSSEDEGTPAKPIEVGFTEPLEIPSNTTADPLLLTECAPIILSGEGVEPGRFVDVSFSFSNGQTVRLDAPVVRRPQEGGLYEDVPDALDPTSEPAAGADCG